MMKESAVHIESHSDLVALKTSMQSWREDMGRLLNAVDSYMLDRLKAYKRLEDSLAKELEKAEAELGKAQEALSAAREELNSAESEYGSCCASQHWVEDEDGNEELRPSCSSEAARAAGARSRYDVCKAEEERCRQYYDECKERYEKCKRIIAECTDAQNSYKENGPLYTGAEEWIRAVSEDHTQKGCDAIDRILEILGRYHNRNLTAEAADAMGAAAPVVSKAARFDAAAEKVREMEAQLPTKAERFDAAKRKIEFEMASAASLDRVREPNAIAICTGCGRPVPICICSRIYERTR